MMKDLTPPPSGLRTQRGGTGEMILHLLHKQKLFSLFTYHTHINKIISLNVTLLLSADGMREFYALADFSWKIYK